LDSVYGRSGQRKTQMFWHDMFNISTLAMVCVLIGIYIVQGTEIEIAQRLYSHYTTKGRADMEDIAGLNIAPSVMGLYYIIFYIVMSYLFVDVVWVLLVPSCVPSSPRSIVVHHVATAALMMSTFVSAPEQYSWSTVVYLSVELNTVILVSKRNLRIGSPIWMLLDLLFYVSWVVQRLIAFPFLTWWTSWEYIRYSHSHGSLVNVCILTPFFSFLLTFLSFKWTYQLLVKKGKPKGAVEEKRKD
jgi:hypothetical protein